jgi:TetR/AcrR family tetracycline transcriptional repressor
VWVNARVILLEAMTESMLDGLTHRLDESLPWHERLSELAHRLRCALLAHRDGARIFAGVFFPLPNALAYGETMIGLLRDAGRSSRDAAWAVDTVTYYVVGHTIEEQLALAAGLPDGGREAAERLTEALDPLRHPNMLAALDDIPAPHGEEHFAYGLAIIVTGLLTGR